MNSTHFTTRHQAVMALAALAVILLVFGASATAAAISAAPGALLAIGPLGFLERKSGHRGDDDDDDDVVTIKRLHASVQAFIERHALEMADVRSEVDGLLAKSNRPAIGDATHAAESGAATPPETWRESKSGRPLPVLDREHSLAAHTGGRRHDTPSVGRVLRGLVLGGRADDAAELAEERKALSMAVDPAGGFTVGGTLAAEWIDRLRARMVLQQAGCRTIPMEGRDLTLARLTGDPAVSWHGENAALTASDPTFGAITLTARTVVCLVKLSLELAQDSVNIEQILQTSLTGALAGAIDSAGLVGVTVDAGAAPAGLFDLSGRNSITAIGAPASWDFVVDGMYELAADNVPLDAVGALVAHPKLWQKMRKLKTGLSGDNSTLPMPDEVARLPKLWTTAAPLSGGTTAKAIIADWRDLLFGVRQQINVRVLSEAFLGSNLQVAVLAYARCDFAAVRPQSFCTLEGITV